MRITICVLETMECQLLRLLCTLSLSGSCSCTSRFSIWYQVCVVIRADTPGKVCAVCWIASCWCAAPVGPASGVCLPGAAQLFVVPLRVMVSNAIQVSLSGSGEGSSCTMHKTLWVYRCDRDLCIIRYQSCAHSSKRRCTNKGLLSSKHPKPVC